MQRRLHRRRRNDVAVNAVERADEESEHDDATQGDAYGNGESDEDPPHRKASLFRNVAATGTRLGSAASRS